MVKNLLFKIGQRTALVIFGMILSTFVLYLYNPNVLIIPLVITGVLPRMFILPNCRIWTPPASIIFLRWQVRV